MICNEYLRELKPKNVKFLKRKAKKIKAIKGQPLKQADFTL